jgi:hypothetical protein
MLGPRSQFWKATVCTLTVGTEVLTQASSCSSSLSFLKNLEVLAPSNGTFKRPDNVHLLKRLVLEKSDIGEPYGDMDDLGEVKLLGEVMQLAL